MKKGLLVFVFLFLSLLVIGQTCTLNVSLSASNPSICSGSAVILTAAASGGTAPYTYVWNTGETTASISVNKAGPYSVSVTDKSTGCPAVVKNITVTAAPVPDAPTVAGTSVCINTSATLTATAPGGTYQWYDSAGNFLFTGNPFVTPPIKSGTNFLVETTINGCTSQKTSVNVSLLSRPTVTGASVCAGNSATLSASGGDSYDWYAASSGGGVIFSGPIFKTPPLQNTTTYYVVSIVSGCASARTPVTATVGVPPDPPVASNTSVCAGSSANLHADAPAGIFDWFDVPFGGTSLISSPDYTTPPLNTTTTYYVQTSLNNCVSTRKAVTVTVNQIPAAPIVSGPVSICQGTSTILSVTSPTDTYKWYDALSGGNLLQTGNSFTTPALNSPTTYYVQTVAAGGCSSVTRTAITVNINTPTPPPSVPPKLICTGSSATLTATSPGGTYRWYNTPNAVTPLFTGNGYVTPPLNTTTIYYVETTINGCTSARTLVRVNVLPSPTAPTASNTTVCAGNPAILTGSGSSGDYEWYDAATNGNLLSASQVYVTPALSITTTYYLQTTNSNGCPSARTPVTVTVNPIPTAPGVTGGSVCKGNPITLTASAPSGIIRWYDAAVGGNLIYTGSNYIIPALTLTTTYYVENVVGSCVSSRKAVIASVISVPNPQFQYPIGTYCASAPSNPLPVINNPAGGTFSASPAGLVFVDNQTGEINLGATAQGTYTISFTSNGTCPNTTSATVAIVSTPNTVFSYGGPYCQDGVNPLPTFPIGSSTGVFTSAPGGLVFQNASTGEINLAASKPGTYKITNTTNASGSCASSVSTSSVTIDQRATVSAGPNQIVGAGTPVQLAGSITGAASAKWSGGTGSFSDPTKLNAVYTPAAGETLVTLTLTTADPPGPCGPKSDNMTITINPLPAMPIAPGAPVCIGNSANLSTLGPGGTYRWYDAATSGNLLFTGPVYATPPLIVNTTYYVQTTINGATSARTPVTVTVTASPAAPTAVAQPACSGSSTVLTASGSTGSYEWYDAQTLGNLVYVGDTFPTLVLTANTSYYVQTTVNGCTSPRTQVDVPINPVPVVTSTSTDNVCSGNPLNYTITADLPGTTFTWSRAALPGISNPAVNNRPSGVINETLVNTGTSSISVTYLITPHSATCAGTPFQYVVTVFPKAVVVNNTISPICNKTSTDYAIQFNVPGTSAKWSRAEVPGISNRAVPDQAAPVIREVLFNTTNAPVDVTYIFTYGSGVCAGLTFPLVVTVNPAVNITSAATNTDPVCIGTAQNYVITSNIPSATYSWSRDAVPNISNLAVSGKTSSTINETLVNTSTKAIKVAYVIIPTANGCTDEPFTYTVTVTPQPPIPVANGNSPVCIGSTIQLSTPTIPKATYLWTGPKGFSSTSQNPKISNVSVANSGTYNLFVTINGCTSQPSPVDIVVDPLPIVDAGPDQRICALTPSVQLDGNVTGGTNTGLWSTDGSGTFTPSTNTLKAVYIPSQADKDAGSVTLHLTSTSKDDCSPKVDHMTLTFKPSPAVDAGDDIEACSQDPAVPLNGKIFIGGGIIWTTSGTGSFIPSANQLNASYAPSAADIQSGSVTLTIRATSAGPCDIDNDKMVIKFIPPPTVNAGGTRYVLKGYTIVLDPTVSDRNVKYLWTPNIDINDNTVRNPEIKGDIDRTYTLTVTDSRGCVNSDKTFIKVSPTIVVPNTFTPNGDGTNDLWNVTGLIAYVNSTVDIFDRYGQKIFHSLGYPKPWDGTYNGKLLPVGTYYYIIDTKLNGLVLSGYIAIIR